MSIYAQALGSGFASLAPVLKRLHGSSECRKLSGVLQIRIGRHPLAGLLLWLCRLPRVQAATPTRLQVVPSRDGERWLRHFGRWKLFTHQRNGLFDAANGSTAEILERFGPVTLGLQLCIKEQGLIVRSTGTRLFGMMLPRWLSIGVAAHEQPVDENSFCCDVRLSMPCLGRLLRYSGKLSFQDSPVDLQSSRSPA